MVEEVQLPRLPESRRARQARTSRCRSIRRAAVTFTDIEAINGGRSYSLWDFISEINAVVLYVTDGDDASFTLLQRTTGRKIELPADPKLSPDRPRLVTADFCDARCTNEVALWRVTPRRRAQGARRGGRPRPGPMRSRRGRTRRRIAIDYTVEGAAAPSRTHPRARRPRLGCARPRSDLPAERDPCTGPYAASCCGSGRMSSAQQRALETLWPAFGIPFAASPLDFDRVVRPARAARARDRVRHGRDHGGDRARPAERGFPRHRSACAGRGQPPEADSPKAASPTCASSGTTPSKSSRR